MVTTERQFVAVKGISTEPNPAVVQLRKLWDIQVFPEPLVMLRGVRNNMAFIAHLVSRMSELEHLLIFVSSGSAVYYQPGNLIVTKNLHPYTLTHETGHAFQNITNPNNLVRAKQIERRIIDGIATPEEREERVVSKTLDEGIATWLAIKSGLKSTGPGYQLAVNQQNVIYAGTDRTDRVMQRGSNYQRVVTRFYNGVQELKEIPQDQVSKTSYGYIYRKLHTLTYAFGHGFVDNVIQELSQFPVNQILTGMVEQPPTTLRELMEHGAYARKVKQQIRGRN